MECSIPLTTKYWTIDHGTLLSIPNSSFIEKINTDIDGIFTFNCKSENEYLHFGLQNLPEKFDYTITIFGLTDLVKPDLNSSVQFSRKDLFSPKNMHLFVDQKLKISYNFFFYEKLESSKANEMRKFIHQKYNYIPETPIIPFSTLPICPIGTAVASTKKIFEIPKSQNSCNTFSNIQNPNIFSPFKCDVVFYVNCLNPSLQDFSDKLITSEEMVKTFKLPDGSKATTCKMEYFMEENFGKYNLDMKDFELYKKFKSLKRFRICTGCGIKESDIWQMNFNGYYLCSTCSFGSHKFASHKCYDTRGNWKSHLIKEKNNGFCPRCLFYYKSSKPENSDIQITEYSASEFFKILTLNNLQNQIPDMSIWENKQKTFQRQLVKYESDIFDIHEETFSDIVTIKDAEKLPPTNIVLDVQMQSETNNDEINDEWEIADKISETNSENDFVVA